MRVVCFEVDGFGYRKGNVPFLDVDLPQVIDGMIINVDGKSYRSLQKTFITFVCQSSSRGGDTEFDHIEMEFVVWP